MLIYYELQPRKILSLLILMSICLVTKAQIPTNYYSSVSGLTGDNLKSSLNNIIDGHTEYSYSDLWDILKVTDVDPNNSSSVIGFYSRFSMDAAAEYDGGSGWNREHVWAKSRGDFGTSTGAGTDLHHIRASDISTNSARGNRVFDEGGTVYVDAAGNYSGTTPAKEGTSLTWEPGDDQKGDVARMIFYMATRYEGENGEVDLELNDVIMSNSDDSPFHGKLSVLLDWHDEDPVSTEETNRHEAIYSYQNNRNPFIDHPEYVDEIWGDTDGGDTDDDDDTDDGDDDGGETNGSYLFISEYIEGSSNNKAIELGNLTGASVNLSSYTLKKQVNGAGSWSTALALSGTLADGEAYAIAYSSASFDLTSIADLTSSSSVLAFNGNDPVGLFKDDVLVDIVGDFDSGSSNFAQNTTLIRNSDQNNTSYTASEWDTNASDTFTYYGSLSTTSSGGGSTGSTDIPTGYCTSEGSNSSYEWLDYIQVGSLVNSSGENGGYQDYTSQTVTLATGASVSYEFRPGFSGSTYQETYRVWIDFNRDGDFGDSDELVVDESLTSATVTGSFTIPSSVSAGNTRMRISMKYNGSASTCETFSYGEVEDYQVLLSGSGASRVTSIDSSSDSTHDFEVYPNPAYSYIDIAYTGELASFNVAIYDAEGKQLIHKMMSSSQRENRLDVSDLKRGLYFLVVGDKLKQKLVLR